MMGKVVKIGKAAIPALKLVKGMNTTYNVCLETTGTETLRMGVCHHDPDMDDMKWQGKVEEAFYVAKGSIKVAWDDGQGDKGEAVIREGEQIFLPKGYQYALKSTGEPAINVFAIAGGPTGVTRIVGEEFGAKLKKAGSQL
jgi:mannose-6-phosphate isomerase-like protein (cupin superfamily)